MRVRKKTQTKSKKRMARKRRIQARRGAVKRLRLAVFRSLKHIYGQIIDDVAQKTLIAASDLEFSKKLGTKSEIAFAVGELLAKKAAEKKIKEVVFDRGGFKYHGRIKALADGARKGGLEF